jgi:hypothetical protein
MEGKSELPGQTLSGLWNDPGLGESWPAPLTELAENRYPGKIDRAAIRQMPTAISGAMKSIVTPQWQLIIHSTMRIQLYDHARDPGELNNLADSPSGKAMVRQLQMEIAKRLGGQSAPNPGDSPQELRNQIFAISGHAARVTRR